MEHNRMILAIDPGNEQSAWCLLADGKPVKSGKVDNMTLLGDLRSGGLGNGCSTVAIEMIASYGMAVGKEVFETCVWVGRFREAWERTGGEIRLVYRKEVKLYLCETVRANDSNIRAAIVDRFGGKEKAIGKKANPGPLFGINGDAWSALAVALTIDGGVNGQATGHHHRRL